MSDPKGFKVGDTPDDDVVPTIFSTNIDKDNKLIWDVLSTVFKTGTPEHRAVMIFSGHGYEALYNLIAKSHPGIVEEPARLILHRPQQNKLSLLEYFNKYEHYLMLKSYIENISAH